MTPFYRSGRRAQRGPRPPRQSPSDYVAESVRQPRSLDTWSLLFALTRVWIERLRCALQHKVSPTGPCVSRTDPEMS